MKLKTSKKMNMYALVVLGLYLALIATLVYEGISLYGLYKLWNEQTSYPTTVRASRVNFDAHRRASERFQKGTQYTSATNPGVNDPFAAFDLSTEQQNP